jgi:hypothetical protein
MDIHRERAQLVAFLSKMFPASKWIDEREPAYPVIGIDSFAGQMSWHVHPDDMDLFDHVTEAGTWDGHTTEEKYDRLARIGDDFAYLMGAFLPAIENVMSDRVVIRDQPEAEPPRQAHYLSEDSRGPACGFRVTSGVVTSVTDPVLVECPACTMTPEYQAEVARRAGA